MKANFTLCGEWATDHIRHRVASGDIQGAISFFNCFIPDNPNSVPNYDKLFKDIIVGKRGFKGVTPNVHLDEYTKNEDITELALRAAYGNEENSKAVEIVAKILDIDDPIEYLVSFKRFVHKNPKEFTSGWISKHGYYVPAGFAQHDQTCHDIDEQFNLELHNPVAFFERRWIRISYAYQGEYQVIQCHGGEMTEQQEEALLKYVEAHPSLHEKLGYVFINNYGFIKDGKLTKDK